MSTVEVEIAREATDEDRGSSGQERSQERSQRRSRASSTDPDVEREVTKRELIRSVSNILIVVLYMVFTLLRDRDAGVVVMDGDEDDWE